jgi:hypothetical protein
VGRSILPSPGHGFSTALIGAMGDQLSRIMEYGPPGGSRNWSYSHLLHEPSRPFTGLPHSVRVSISVSSCKLLLPYLLPEIACEEFLPGDYSQALKWIARMGFQGLL